MIFIVIITSFGDEQAPLKVSVIIRSVEMIVIIIITSFFFFWLKQINQTYAAVKTAKDHT